MGRRDNTETSLTDGAAGEQPANDVMSFIGAKGHPFNIRAADGVDFGGPGTLVIADRLVPDVYTWRSDMIKGQLPPDQKSGAIVATNDKGEVFHGFAEVHGN